MVKLSFLQNYLLDFFHEVLIREFSVLWLLIHNKMTVWLIALELW